MSVSYTHLPRRVVYGALRAVYAVCQYAVFAGFFRRYSNGVRGLQAISAVVHNKLLRGGEVYVSAVHVGMRAGMHNVRRKGA